MKLLSHVKPLKLLFLIVAAGAFCLALSIIFIHWTGPNDDIVFDTSDADFIWLDQGLSAITHPRIGGAYAEGHIDFSRLNGGKWKKVCAIGGYVDPIKTVTTQGGIVSETDRENFLNKNYGSQLGIVEESEFMIAYIRPDNSSHFIHFKNGIGPDGQNFKKCIERPATVISFS
jgi:hypothetical protein